MITNAPSPNAATATATDIRDIKPPIEISNGYAWLWQLLMLLAIAVAACHLHNRFNTLLQ